MTTFKKTYSCLTPQDIEDLVLTLNDNAGEYAKHLPLTVEIYGEKEKRSREQNKLYWKWLEIISKETGDTKEDLHERFKRTFLLPILCREDAEFEQAINAIKKSRAELGDEYEIIARQIVGLCSTTQLTVSQFTEYLTQIERWAAEQGYVLTTGQK